MEYRAIYTDQEDLEHGLFGKKGSQKKDHKYLLREWYDGYRSLADVAKRK